MKSLLIVLMLCQGFTHYAVAAEPQLVRVLLKADVNGDLESIYLDGTAVEPSPDEKLSCLEVLQSKVRSLVENADGTRKAKEFAAEIEIETSNLKYKYVTQVIFAITRYKREDRAEPVPLIESVKFAAPKK